VTADPIALFGPEAGSFDGGRPVIGLPALGLTKRAGSGPGRMKTEGPNPGTDFRDLRPVLDGLFEARCDLRRNARRRKEGEARRRLDGNDVFRRRKLDYPKATVTSISIYMRLTLVASGQFLTMLPTSMLRHPTDKTWLRALAVRLDDSSGHIAAITLRKRRARGAVELFQRASREVAASL
jgi:DNA-binding transcriptional LysR family regulator